MMHRYTPEQKEFIKEHVTGRTSNELLEMVNQQFELSLKLNQIRAYVKNNKLKSGVSAQFQKGHSPANKGKKGMGGWLPTCFKKGTIPPNYKPVGTERISKDGYVEIKVADPKTWKGKHRIVWESANGPIPKGHVVIFGDKNRRNFDVDNLILVSRAQLALLNKHELIQNDADLTRTGVIVADLHRKIAAARKAK